MTTPTSVGSSGAAEKAAKRFPSAASRTRSSWETAAPLMTGIGGSESSSKHTTPPTLQRRRNGLLGNGSWLVAAAVEAERRVLIRHQGRVCDHAQDPAIEAEDEGVKAARITLGEEQREPDDQRQEPDQTRERRCEVPAVRPLDPERSAADEHPGDQELWNRQHPLDQRQTAQQRAWVGNVERRRIVRLRVEGERRVAVCPERAVAVVRHAPRPSQHAEVEVEDASRVAAGHEDRDP